MLARKPPAWLWLPEEVAINGAWWDGDVDELELGPAELRTLFERKMEKRVGSKYVEDAFGKGWWIQRVWRFLLYGFKNSEDDKRFDRLVGEWIAIVRVASRLPDSGSLYVFLVDFIH